MTPDEIQKDRETPSTSWAVWAWQAYRDGALVDPATLTAENAALKERVAELEARVKALAEALEDAVVVVHKAYVSANMEAVNTGPSHPLKKQIDGWRVRCMNVETRARAALQENTDATNQ